MLGIEVQSLCFSFGWWCDSVLAKGFRHLHLPPGPAHNLLLLRPFSVSSLSLCWPGGFNEETARYWGLKHHCRGESGPGIAPQGSSLGCYEDVRNKTKQKRINHIILLMFLFLYQWNFLTNIYTVVEFIFKIFLNC